MGRGAPSRGDGRLSSAVPQNTLILWSVQPTDLFGCLPVPARGAHEAAAPARTARTRARSASKGGPCPAAGWGYTLIMNDTDLSFDVPRAIDRLVRFLAVEGVTGQEAAIGLL